jgi:hypothetical protein
VAIAEHMFGRSALNMYLTPSKFESMMKEVTPADVRRLMTEITPGSVTVAYKPGSQTPSS